MSYRVIGAPSSILSNAASRVNYQLNAEIRSKDKKMMPTLKDNFKKLILIGLPIFLTIYLTAPFLFGQIFGESWAEAGWYAQVLVPWLFVMFLTSPLAPILTVLKLQDVTLKYDVVLLIARVLAILAPIIIFDNIEMSVISFSIIGFMFNSWLLFFIFKTVKKYDEVYG